MNDTSTLIYDVSHPARREFHRAYIRKSLENLAGNSNVIQVLGEEYTGPLSFVQFWLDTIAEWLQRAYLASGPRNRLFWASAIRPAMT